MPRLCAAHDRCWQVAQDHRTNDITKSHWQGQRLTAYLRTMSEAITSTLPAEALPRQRKPDWIRVKAPTSKGYGETRQLMRDLKLNTVCEEAACPNIGECWTKKHATVMILGDVCTRACAHSATSRRGCRALSI